MVRTPLAVWCALLLGVATLVLPTGAPANADASPVHSVAVSGDGVGMYPAFDPQVDRYAVTTTSSTQGTVSVTATTSDPAGVVLVDGRPTTAAVTVVSGLSEGDEISVIFHDSGGTEVHSLVYLPAGFPTLIETVPAAPGAAQQAFLMNLSRYDTSGTPNFEAAVDHRGVPAYVRSFPTTASSTDLKPLGSTGHYTVQRAPTPTAGHSGSQVVELDGAFHQVRTYENLATPADGGQPVNTDSHDAIVRPDGSRILLGYQPNPGTGLTDAVVQEVSAAGQVVYTWDSADHMTPSAETTSNPGQADYAHVNSVFQLPGGDLLVSFRHLSSVYRIAWSDHDGFHRGDIEWRLGGRHSDFRFLDDPDGGPCAQHDVTMLPNGHILLFDNGSVALGGDPVRCIDPNDPTGPTMARDHTRIAEYALDTVAQTATLVWSYTYPTGRFTFFAGSAQRLPDGHTVIGWAADRRALASEVAADGTLLWELRDDDQYLSYRVVTALVPDTVAPTIQAPSPAAGARYAYGAAVVPDFSCTDRGGSDLRTCAGSRTALDTRTPGRHTWTATATDGAGHVTTLTRTYTVAAAPSARPDAAVSRPGGRWVGDEVYGGPGGEQVTGAITRRGHVAIAYARFRDVGTLPDTVHVRGSLGGPRFSVHYFQGARDVTALVGSGGWSVSLRPGQSTMLRVVVRRSAAARAGARTQVLLRATGAVAPGQPDAVAFRVRAGRHR